VYIREIRGSVFGPDAQISGQPGLADR